MSSKTIELVVHTVCSLYSVKSQSQKSTENSFCFLFGLVYSGVYIRTFDNLIYLLSIIISVSEYTIMHFKSPRRASTNLQKSPFTKDQIIWVIYKFGELENIQIFQKLFMLEFCSNNPREIHNYNAFNGLVNRFEESGCQTGLRSPKEPEATSQADIALVKEFFINNQEANRDLDLSVGKIREDISNGKLTNPMPAWSLG